ncbi:hypothetical protein AB0K35_27760 [Micromonospora sp. NPDC053740]|uniref:hypothetical protein n=1 Tax=Micromonospora TaxID=1873 RepID=UPI001EE7CC62|nr:hypothetical protein [Micromonospora alfalfae]
MTSFPPADWMGSHRLSLHRPVMLPEGRLTTSTVRFVFQLVTVALGVSLAIGSSCSSGGWLR